MLFIRLLFVATRRVSLSGLDAALRDVFTDAVKRDKVKAEQGLRAAMIDTWGDVITETPVDEGRARGNWFITHSVPSSGIGGADKNKGNEYVTNELNGQIFGKSWFLANNLPYAYKLEYGGFTDKPSTEKTIGGYSRLAPHGMVRRNMLQFPAKLRQFTEAAFR